MAALIVEPVSYRKEVKALNEVSLKVSSGAFMAWCKCRSETGRTGFSPTAIVAKRIERYKDAGHGAGIAANQVAFAKCFCRSGLFH